MRTGDDAVGCAWRHENASATSGGPPLFGAARPKLFRAGTRDISEAQPIRHPASVLFTTALGVPQVDIGNHSGSDEYFNRGRRPDAFVRDLT